MRAGAHIARSDCSLMFLQESVCSLPRLWMGGIAMLAILCLTTTADASVGLVKQLGGPEDDRTFQTAMHRTLLQSEYTSSNMQACL